MTVIDLESHRGVCITNRMDSGSNKAACYENLIDIVLSILSSD